MTKEQKILFMFVLAIAASSSVYYVVQQKNLDASSIVDTSAVAVPEKKTITGQGAPAAQGSLSESEEEGEDDDRKTTTGTAPVTPPVTTPVVQVAPTGATPGSISKTKSLKKSLVYNVPDHMQESITVTLVVDSTGKIADVTFAYDTPTNRESADYLSRFSSAFSPSLVAGKKMSEVSLSRVGGASLTTRAFNKAVADLSTQL